MQKILHQLFMRNVGSILLLPLLLWRIKGGLPYINELAPHCMGTFCQPPLIGALHTHYRHHEGLSPFTLHDPVSLTEPTKCWVGSSSLLQQYPTSTLSPDLQGGCTLMLVSCGLPYMSEQEMCLLLHQRLLPKMSYTLHGNLFTVQQCSKLNSIIQAPFLPGLGLNRHFPSAVLTMVGQNFQMCPPYRTKYILTIFSSTSVGIKQWQMSSSSPWT